MIDIIISITYSYKTGYIKLVRKKQHRAPVVRLVIFNFVFAFQLDFQFNKVGSITVSPE